MKTLKKVTALVVALMMIVSSLTACGSDSKEKGSAEESGDKKEVYIFIRDRGDLSFWDSMAEGSDRAVKDFKDRANVHVIETTENLQANLQAMYEAADAGANLIITAADFKDNLVEVANEYPEIAFAIIQENVLKECENDNVYGVDFATSQAAYLGGIAAADIAKNGTSDVEPSNVIGFIGGMDEAMVIQEFLWGYIQGAKAYNPETKIVYNYVGAWNDPDTAKTQAMTQYDDAKADVIFACAGGSGNGVHNAAAEAGKYVIGVDSDQSKMYADDQAIQERFATSVVKEVGNAVYNIVEKYLDKGELPFGKFEILGLSDEAVGIVEGDVLDALLSEEGKAALEKAKAGIADGSIKVESALGRSQDEIKAFINENCQ